MWELRALLVCLQSFPQPLLASATTISSMKLACSHRPLVSILGINGRRLIRQPNLARNISYLRAGAHPRSGFRIATKQPYRSEFSRRSLSTPQGTVEPSATPSILPPQTWVDRTPTRIRPYLQLTRIDKPIGTMLLFYPCGKLFFYLVQLTCLKNLIQC